VQVSGDGSFPFLQYLGRVIRGLADGSV